MEWILLLLLGCAPLANRFATKQYLDSYLAIFPWANERALKQRYRTTETFLGCVFIALGVARLSFRLWVQSPAQRTIVALWVAFVCAVALIFGRTVLAFRATNPTMGTRLSLTAAEPSRPLREGVEQRPGFLETLWEPQEDPVKERARRRARSSLIALVALLLVGIVAGAILEFIAVLT